ncbi:MAG: hypothetical protein WBB26_03940 [Saprospiraceae bacterium]
MKKGFAIFFLVLYVVSTTQVIEILKLPMLLSHFQDHRIQDKEISFLDFLEMHYLNGNPIDEDYAQDMKLPFKSTGESTINFISFYTPCTYFEPFDVAPIKEGTQKFFDHHNMNASSFLSSIWQPPKAC